MVGVLKVSTAQKLKVIMKLLIIASGLRAPVSKPLTLHSEKQNRLCLEQLRVVKAVRAIYFHKHCNTAENFGLVSYTTTLNTVDY